MRVRDFGSSLFFKPAKFTYALNNSKIHFTNIKAPGVPIL